MIFNAKTTPRGAQRKYFTSEGNLKEKTTWMKIWNFTKSLTTQWSSKSQSLGKDDLSYFVTTNQKAKGNGNMEKNS